MHAAGKVLNSLTNWLLLAVYTGFRLVVLIVFAVAEDFRDYSGLGLIIAVFTVIEAVNGCLALRQAARLKNAELRMDQPVIRFSYVVLLTASNLAAVFICTYGVIAAGETILLHPLWLLVTLFECGIAVASFVLIKRLIDLFRHRSGIHSMKADPAAGFPA